MYEPQEDSYLLKEEVKIYAHGIVLDMGTGSGIQALEAANSKKVVKVYAVDIDRESIEYCKNNINHKKIKFLRSNLFSAFEVDKRFKGIKFDTIIFNAPYLPQDEGIEDPALYGGKHGYEIITLFLNRCIRYIKPTTDIILVFSSITGKEKVENFLTKKRFEFRKVSEKHVFFEDIYVYLIRRFINY